MDRARAGNVCMNSRNAILAAVRAATPAAVARPDVALVTRGFGTDEDLVGRFSASALLSGASVIRATPASLDAELLTQYPLNGRRLSVVEAVLAASESFTPHS